MWEEARHFQEYLHAARLTEEEGDQTEKLKYHYPWYNLVYFQTTFL